MNPKRIYQTFTYREAVFRICCERYDVVTHAIVEQRHLLEAYIQRHPEFQQALVPIALQPEVATETKSLFVAIEAQSDLCRGQSVVDHFGVMGREPNAEVVLKASRDQFWEMLCDAVRMQ